MKNDSDCTGNEFKDSSALEIRNPAFETPVSSWVGSRAGDGFAFRASFFTCRGVDIALEFGGYWSGGVGMKESGQVCLTLEILELALVVSWKGDWAWTIDGDMPFEEAERGVVAIHDVYNHVLFIILPIITPATQFQTCFHPCDACLVK